MGSHKSSEEDAFILESIEKVSRNLSDGVEDLQGFIRDLKKARQRRMDGLKSTQGEHGDIQYG